MAKLSDAARAILIAASDRTDHLALPPERLPIAAQRSMVQSLLRVALLEEIVASGDQPAWRTDEAGERHALRLTRNGMAAVAPGVEIEAASRATAETDPYGAEPAAQGPLNAGSHHAAQESPSASGNTRRILRAASHAVLAAWEVQGHPDLPSAMDALQTALSARTAHASSSTPRPNTKRAKVLALLHRAEGATVAQVAEVTGWTRHTVHGFFAGLKKGGTPIEVLERVRQVGPGKQGAAGSYTVYRIGEVG